jgi:hypothetical protein
MRGEFPAEVPNQLLRPDNPEPDQVLGAGKREAPCKPGSAGNGAATGGSCRAGRTLWGRAFRQGRWDPEVGVTAAVIGISDPGRVLSRLSLVR